MEKTYWDNEIHKTYTEGMNMLLFKHIKKISYYNHNYYIGLKGDLLFAKSDDDNTTEWYLIRGNNQPYYLGCSYVTGGDLLRKVSNT